MLLVGVSSRPMPRRAPRRDGQRGATNGSSNGYGGRASVGRRRACAWPLLDIRRSRRGTMLEAAAFTAPCPPTVPGGGFDAFLANGARGASGGGANPRKAAARSTGGLQGGLQKNGHLTDKIWPLDRHTNPPTPARLRAWRHTGQSGFLTRKGRSPLRSRSRRDGRSGRVSYPRGQVLAPPPTEHASRGREVLMVAGAVGTNEGSRGGGRGRVGRRMPAAKETGGRA